MSLRWFCVLLYIFPFLGMANEVSSPQESPEINATQLAIRRVSVVSQREKWQEKINQFLTEKKFKEAQKFVKDAISRNQWRQQEAQIAWLFLLPIKGAEAKENSKFIEDFLNSIIKMDPDSLIAQKIQDDMPSLIDEALKNTQKPALKPKSGQ